MGHQQKISPEKMSLLRSMLKAYPDDVTLLVDERYTILLAEGEYLKAILPKFQLGLSQNLTQVWDDSLLDIADNFIKSAFIGNSVEWRYYATNHILHFRASPVIYDNKIRYSLILVNNKTTEFRNYEQLRSDAERYRAIVEDNIELICRFTPEGILTFVNGAMCSYTNKDSSDLIGTSFYRLSTDINFVQIQKSVEALSTDNPNTVMEIRFRSFGNKHHWVRWSFHAITDAGGNISEIQSVGYDITDKVRAQVIEKKHRNFAEAMSNIAAVLNSTLDLQRVLENIIDIIDLVVRYDTVNVMLVEDAYATVVRGRGYSEHNIKGVSSLKLRIRRIKHLRYMMETQHELVIPNVAHYDSQCLDVPELCWVQSYAGAPIISEGKVIGFLNLESFVPDFFELEHGRLVRAFADHAATAIRNAQLFEQAQRIAVVEERQRLARELHDAVSQTLFSANMIADSLPLLAQKHPEAIPEQIKILRQQTQLAMAELRAMLYELRPQSLADVDIVTLLEQLIKAFTNRTAMDITLTISEDETIDLALNVKVALYRIAQESLNNAIQHARATHADVSLQSIKQQLTLTIIDNGYGFNIDQENRGHMGLRIMRERAEAIYADFDISSSVGTGTIIIVTYNVKRQNNEQ